MSEEIFDYVTETGKVLVTGTLDEIAHWESENVVVDRIEPFVPPKNWDGQFVSNWKLVPHK